MDEWDMLEQGVCREVLRTECSLPLEKKSPWQECFIMAEKKSEFIMVDEKSGEVLLTAKRCKDGSFYISQYEDFPGTFQLGKKQDGRKYCGVLRLNRARNGYKLYSCSCELCDNHLNRFSCGLSTSEDERQLLAVIKHGNRTIENTDIDARCIDVDVPAILSNSKQRVVWCPRTMSKGIQGDVVEETKRLFRTGSSSNSSYREGNSLEHEEQKEAEEHLNKKQAPPKNKRIGILFENPEADRLQLKTKLPSWNDDIGSLVLKFRNKRVQLASSKNFILTANGDPNEMVFQLGKVDSGRFNVDFKHPMSPLQAFGIALSAYGFTAKGKK